MEKLKSIAKSIWAKIPKTKTEFKDLFDKCRSFLEHWLHKIWAFLKSAYAWVINFYQKHSKLIHNAFYAIAILIWFAVLVIILINLYELYFAKEKADSWTSEVRMAVFTLTAWIGAPFLVWRTMIASKQANTAQEKAYTELFTQAVEQLGSVKPVGKDQYEVNIEVRVGALYALERIMHDSDKDAKTIIDTLCTYVKHNCGKSKFFENEIPEDQLEKLSEDERETENNKFILALQENPPANRYDIQTALKIIGRRPEKNRSENEMPDLSEVNLQGANLDHFDLSLCNLANAHLARTMLTNSNFNGANLWRAHLWDADLRDASLQSAILDDANFQRAIVWDADLRGANLIGVNMQGTYLIGANLQEANLQMADLQEADMQGVNLRGANLQEADLEEALINEVFITEANITAVSVLGVDFTKAKYDFDTLQAQVMDMFGHKTLTILPERMEIPDHWSEIDIGALVIDNQYEREWWAFKKEKGFG